MNLTAQWIWRPQDDYNQYNDAIEARRNFTLTDPESGILAITADSWFRVFINGEWVADGPCRSWPEHYQYDVIDVSTYLCSGDNTIEVLARYFGVGNFHQVPQQAGLLAQLEIVQADGQSVTITTDEQWETCDFAGLIRNVPKASVQMEPFEYIDARFAYSDEYGPARVLYAAEDGPWKDLNARDCPLLTREPFAFGAFLEANVVNAEFVCYAFPVGRLIYPGLIEANNALCKPAVLATCIVSDREQHLDLAAPALTITINGERADDGRYTLKKGENLLLAVLSSPLTHWSNEVRIQFLNAGGFTLSNPLDSEHENPWCMAVLDEFRFISDDIQFALMDAEKKQAFLSKMRATFEDIVQTVTTSEAFRERLGGMVRQLPSETMLMEEPNRQFQTRTVIADGTQQVDAPAALMYDNGHITTIEPSALGDIELLYDLGEQNCGFFDLDLIAPEGTVIDIFGVEYITPTGVVQHTGEYRNGMRYICKEGHNRFLSLKRRSQRYAFITLREMTGPVRIRNIRLVESTYPVEAVGAFSCSDARLDRIWEISARTLKLCMEDTYTDCPLYEQTHWVGDARNEAVFGFTAFGAEDLAARCIKLSGQSLERYPIVLCQTPSCWGTLIPAWSFLWGISIWDYFEYTADQSFLQQVWPWVIQNIDNALTMLDDRGLFSGPFWNMFDWTRVDHNHSTVTHNSMFLVGAIDAAWKCAEVLGEKDVKQRLESDWAKLVDAINVLWDVDKGAYPDSVHEDGTISPSTCRHTSFLALLYDIIPPDHRAQALRNVLTPPEGVVDVGSPFAVMYLYEALEKEGYADTIVQLIYENYLPMLEADATTVWEGFSGGTAVLGDGFPTRSHCHAWSSAPVHFLNRIVLGITPKTQGGTAFTVSPRLNGLAWARGATATVHGPVTVFWRREGDTITIQATAPENVALEFVGNDTLDGLRVMFNGQLVD